MINQISKIFILYLFFISLSNATKHKAYNQYQSEAVKLVQNLISQNRYCTDGTEFDIIRNDVNAQKLYVESICSQVPRKNASKELETNYGTQGKLLGKGSFGKVYLFSRKYSNVNYAVKISNSNTLNYKEIFVELNSSACIKEKIYSKNNQSRFAIVEACLWPENNTPRFVMKYFPKSLTDKIDEDFSSGWGSLNNDKKYEMLVLMLQMAKEIEDLHEHDLAHRDLKPDNTLIDEQGNAILADFGLLTPKGLYSKTVAGTPLFLDYEAINHHFTSSPKAMDIYSLALTYANMALGSSFDIYAENMVLGGNYNNNKGTGLPYKPSIYNLNLPNEFKFIYDMTKATNAKPNPRWKIDQVVNYLEKWLDEMSGTNNSEGKIIKNNISKALLANVQANLYANENLNKADKKHYKKQFNYAYNKINQKQDVLQNGIGNQINNYKNLYQDAIPPTYVKKYDNQGLYYQKYVNNVLQNGIYRPAQAHVAYNNAYYVGNQYNYVNNYSPRYNYIDNIAKQKGYIKLLI